jgi:hypothetical protein
MEKIFSPKFLDQNCRKNFNRIFNLMNSWIEFKKQSIIFFINNQMKRDDNKNKVLASVQIWQLFDIFGKNYLRL